MADEQNEDKFTLQVSVLGGVEQFVSTGSAEDVMKAFERWMPMVEAARKELAARRAEAPQLPEPTTPGSAPGKAVSPFKRPS